MKHRRFAFFVMTMAVITVPAFLFLQAIDLKVNNINGHWNLLSRNKLKMRDDNGERTSVHGETDNSNGPISRGILLSKLRQQQAELIRMTYDAIKYPLLATRPDYPHDAIQELRRNVVASVCSFTKNQSRVDAVVPDHLLVDDSHQLIFCQIRKIASIAWRRFLDEAAAWVGGPKLRRLGSYTEAERTFRLQRYKKVMFVREPLLRIISAWNDKFVMVDDHEYQDYVLRYGCDIVLRLGRNLSSHKACVRRHTGDAVDEETGDSRLKVSFEDFGRYLLNGPLAFKNDMHWESYNSRCQPCHVSYDFIGHYETLTPDANHILHALRFEGPGFPQGISSSQHVARRVLSSIDSLLLARLSDLFHVDYNMFGYSARKLQEWVDTDSQDIHV